MLEASAAMNRAVSQCAQAPVSAPSARAQGPTMQMLTEKLAIFKTINKSLNNNKKIVSIFFKWKTNLFGADEGKITPSAHRKGDVRGFAYLMR